jgi:hypothetical protein
MNTEESKVSLLTKLQGLWRRKPAVVEAPLLSYSIIPAAKMAQGESPFDEWHPPNEKIPEGLEADFKGCVWLYQMYIFFLFIEARFGVSTAEKMLEHQASFLNELSADSGKQMKEGVEKIRSVVTAMSQNPEMDVGGKKVPVPLEYAIAYSFFPETTWDNASALVRCLDHGKNSARNVFEAFIQATQIANETVKVQPAMRSGNGHRA